MSRMRLFEDSHWASKTGRAPAEIVAEALATVARIECRFKSRNQLAARIGISPSAFAQYGRGRARPSLLTCQAIFDLAAEIESTLKGD